MVDSLHGKAGSDNRTWPVTEEKEIIMPKAPVFSDAPKLVCARCGQDKLPTEMHQSHNKPTRVCLECVQAKKRAYWASRPKPEKYGTAVLPGSRVMVDFTGREDLLEQIQGLARDEVRSVGDQIIYWCQRFVRSGS